MNLIETGVTESQGPNERKPASYQSERGHHEGPFKEKRKNCASVLMRSASINKVLF